MEANNLKFNLLDKLISIRDITLLEKIDGLLSNVDISKPVFMVSNNQKQMLMKSEEDIRNGNLITDDKLNQDEDLWLNG